MSYLSKVGFQGTGPVYVTFDLAQHLPLTQEHLLWRAVMFVRESLHYHCSLLFIVFICMSDLCYGHYILSR